LWKQLRGGVYATRRLGVKVGEGCRIYTHHFGTEPWLISIGDRVTVTAGVKFITHDGSTWLMRDEKGRRYRYARIEVGNDVFIGLDSILMPGVRIGSRVIVGAGSVVTKSVPDGCLVAGNPARLLGRYDEYRKRVLEQYACAADMKGKTYRERIDSVVERSLRPELKD
jgi:acetyltransferase-like isoleucine patch superfamily enzyme